MRALELRKELFLGREESLRVVKMRRGSVEGLAAAAAATRLLLPFLLLVVVRITAILQGKRGRQGQRLLVSGWPSG